MIPVTEFEHHLKLELRDPKHAQIQREVQRNNQDTTTTDGNEVAKNLARFAKMRSKLRPDLFNDD